MSTFLLVAVLALVIERAAGYPDWLFMRIGHPVTWIGRLIDRLDRKTNRASDLPAARQRAGLRAIIVVVGGTILISLPLQALSLAGTLGLVVTALAASSLLAQRSLQAHVRAVADALDADGLDAGRRAVSMIVGRDPERLDEAAVCRAAIESLAENFSDGVVAPALWIAAAGVSGGAAYKAINTADSMIGHRTERHGDFGRAAARLDDLVNLPASRLSAGLILGAAALVPGASVRGAWVAVRRDARHHRSPNAGWPEAAMAGALGISLAGPRHYGGVLTSDKEMNVGGRRSLGPEDIRRALRLFAVADALLILFLCGCAALSA